MLITDSTVIHQQGTSAECAIQVTDGTLVMTITQDNVGFDYTISEYSIITIPANSIVTFSVNTDTATLSFTRR